MTFVSLEFALLFILTVLAYSRCKAKEQQQSVLLVASYIFYAYWDFRFLLLLIGETFICYFLALKISEERLYAKRKRYCVSGVAVLLLILGFFKYFNFFCDNIEKVFHLNNIYVLSIILPVGISFYTFQAMSYLIDVYRDKMKARRSFRTVALYVAFFPQLVAGPIVRAIDFLPQCDEEHKINRENVAMGCQIFLFGLFKKVVIADRLAVCVDAVFAAPMAFDTISIIGAVISYSLQIYCDFSGYSDMAIGIARFFGLELCQNFDIPYVSSNPTEFWKRWHISLSSWLKDYLYIPLGGNRKGRIRTNFNLFITMLLGGLWHGASWNFIVWGGLHGIALIVHKLYRYRRKNVTFGKNKWIGSLYKGACIACTYCFTCICWIFFRAQNLETAFLILRRIIQYSDGIHYIFIFTIIFGVLIAFAHIYALLFNKGKGYYPILDLTKFRNKIFVCLLVWLIIIFSYDGNNAFIYFQF